MKYTDSTTGVEAVVAIGGPQGTDDRYIAMVRQGPKGQPTIHEYLFSDVPEWVKSPTEHVAAMAVRDHEEATEL